MTTRGCGWARWMWRPRYCATGGGRWASWRSPSSGTATVVAQARSRLAGQMPDGATRLVSLHDPDARPIRKGRIDKPVEFGYKA
jgi:hypothetical protein